MYTEHVYKYKFISFNSVQMKLSDFTFSDLDIQATKSRNALHVISLHALHAVHGHILTHLIIFNFVNLMRSCHQVLMNKRKCDNDDDASYKK